MSNVAPLEIVHAAGGGRPSMTRRLQRLWRARELLRALVMRNLKVKYQRSLLGFAWTLANPLLTVSILVVVFSHVVRIPLPNYWAFLLSGYFVWNFVLQTLNTGTYIFAEHSRLTRSVAFPTEVLVMGAAGSRLLEYAAELVIILVLLATIHHGGVPDAWILLPVLLLLQLLIVIGIALPIATLSVFYYDVQHALPIALTSLFYLSPVFYPASMVPDALQPWYFANPIAGLLTLYHDVLYGGVFPDPGFLGAMIVASVAIYWIGYAVFNRFAPVFPEIV
jgi:ABC-type polysaccharide/polyol phosphate export permease